ncbi:hypothetical protein PSTT_07786, partial [Puccinia striiformis]
NEQTPPKRRRRTQDHHQQQEPGSAESHNNNRSADKNERRSFQGDHHRHRYMTYSSNQKQQSPSSNPSPNQQQQQQQQQPISRLQLNTQQQQLHLGAPINAHYSPNYGSSGAAAQRAPTSKRKPAPVLQEDPPILHSLTPSPSRSQQSNSPSPSPGSRNSHRSSIQKLRKSRSPSPSPRSTTTEFVKKLGSALTAPFRSSNSRRGSDASEIGLSIQDVSRMTCLPGQQILSRSPVDVEMGDHLPSMPSPQANHTTLAEEIVLDTRSGIPQSPERVLRVVNGSASLSTRAASIDSRIDNDEDATQSTSIIPSSSSRFSYQSSALTATRGQQGCKKCLELESKLIDEIERSQNLEKILEDQSVRFEQFRNWSTSKVHTLDHTLKAQEKILQKFEQQMAEKNSNLKVDVKSDYLIALQKDFVLLNSRLALLESQKQHEEEEEEGKGKGKERLSPIPPQDHHHHQQHHQQEEAIIYGRSTPLSYVTKLLEDRNTNEDTRSKTRAYSTPPLASGSSPYSSKPSTGNWKPSSPATMASKLLPISSTSANNSRSAPNTPTPTTPHFSPSSITKTNDKSPCRPRYSLALGNSSNTKAGNSPLGLQRKTPELGVPNRAAAYLGRSPGSPSPHLSASSTNKPSPTRKPTTEYGYARPTVASTRYAQENFVLLLLLLLIRTTIWPVGSHWIANSSLLLLPSTGGVAPLNVSKFVNSNTSNNHFSAGGPGRGVAAVGAGKKKAAVGDLIKLFDNGT